MSWQWWVNYLNGWVAWLKSDVAKDDKTLVDHGNRIAALERAVNNLQAEVKELQSESGPSQLHINVTSVKEKP